MVKRENGQLCFSVRTKQQQKIERIYIVSEVLYPEIDRDINK